MFYEKYYFDRLIYVLKGQSGKSSASSLSIFSMHKCYQKHNIYANKSDYLHKCNAFDNIYELLLSSRLHIEVLGRSVKTFR